MPSEQQLFNLINSLVALAGIWFLLFVLYRNYCMDRFREDIFSLRDEVFDYASAGHISFDSPAYDLLRTTMNGYIRFAHKMGLLQMILFACFLKREDMLNSATNFQEQWNQAIITYPKEIQEQLTTFKTQMNLLSLRYVVNSSPILVITIFAPIILFFLIRHYVVRLVSILHDQFNELDAVALAYGNPQVKTCC